MHLRRCLLFLFVALGPPLLAQSSAPVAISANSVCATIQLPTSRTATVGIQVTGTFSATLQPEVTVNGTTWANTQVTPSTSTTAQSTITAAGVYYASGAGAVSFQVCSTSYSSGTAYVVLYPAEAVNSSLLGGGGTGGTVTSVTATGDGIFDSATPSAAVTTSGTLTLTAIQQAANCVFAGPSSGGSANPLCRALVAADIPSLSGTYLPLTGGTLSGGLTGTTASFSGQITSTLAGGTAPFSITSNTVVPNLNAALLNGATFASPPAAGYGSTTPEPVAATTLSASSTVSGTGFSTYLASPPAIGGTAAAAGTFTTVSAPTHNLGSSGVLGVAVFGNATSGTVTLEPVTGALGTVTASLPANTGTLAELNVAQTWSALQSFNASDIAINGTTITGVTGTGNAVLASGNPNLVGKFGAYNNISTVNSGIPAEYATVDSSNSAAISATTLYTPTATARFRISGSLIVTTAATTSSILGGTTGVVITYTDGTSSVAQSVTMGETSQAGAQLTISSGNTGNTTTTQTQLTPIYIFAKTSVAIQYAVGYTSVGGTAMVYELHLVTEAL